MGIDPGVKGSLCIIDPGDDYNIIHHSSWNTLKNKKKTKAITSINRAIDVYKNYIYPALTNWDDDISNVIIELPALIHNPSTYGLQCYNVATLISNLLLEESHFYFKLGLISPSDWSRICGSDTVAYTIDKGLSLPTVKWKRETVADSYCIARTGAILAGKNKLRSVTQ